MLYWDHTLRAVAQTGMVLGALVLILEHCAHTRIMIEDLWLRLTSYWEHWARTGMVEWCVCDTGTW